MSKPDDQQVVEAKIKKTNIGGYKRHIFVCTGGKCSPQEEGLAVWEHLKTALNERDPGKTVFRTKADCLRICKMGTIALVYPEGTWYGNVTLSNIDRIIDEHLLGGVPVDELKIAENQLP